MIGCNGPGVVAVFASRRADILLSKSLVISCKLALGQTGHAHGRILFHGQWLEPEDHLAAHIFEVRPHGGWDSEIFGQEFLRGHLAYTAAHRCTSAFAQEFAFLHFDCTVVDPLFLHFHGFTLADQPGESFGCAPGVEPPRGFRVRGKDPRRRAEGRRDGFAQQPRHVFVSVVEAFGYVHEAVVSPGPRPCPRLGLHAPRECFHGRSRQPVLFFSAPIRRTCRARSQRPHLASTCLHSLTTL
eukprot:scaffold285_cov330-Pavlova_lutheri.AAC.104